MLGLPARASVCLERSKSAPFGLFGGGAGSAGRIVVTPPDGAERELTSKGSFAAAPGAVIALRAPGSGGYGPAAERDLAKVRDDVVNGYVSAEAAAVDYRVGDRAALSCPHCPSSTPR
jgi:N-methylhydantoinase B